MSHIHPSAVIETGAELADDVQVGSHCYVGAHVKIGSGSVLLHHSAVEGYTTIGKQNVIGSYSVIGGHPQDLKYRGEPTRLEIGDRNQFREYVTVNTGTVTGGGLTKMGNDCLVMAYCHVAHDCAIGDHVIMANYTGLSGHVVLEDYVIISGMCGVTQFLHIGKHAFIGGMTGVRKDVAPYVILVGDPSEVRGLNLVGLRRRGFVGERMKSVMECYRMFFEQGLEKEQALKLIDEKFKGNEDVEYFANFIHKSEKGISR